jgi:hypothetical protein
MTLTEPQHVADTTTVHMIVGVRGHIRIHTPVGGWADEVQWPPQIWTSAGLTWRLEPYGNERPVLAYEIIHDEATGSHDLIVHDTPGDKTT